MTTPIQSSPSAGRRTLLARTALCGALCGLSLLTPQAALALPTGGIPEVNAGGGAPTIAFSSDHVDVTLNAPRTIINWTTFELKPTEAVSYTFGARDWIVLNRIGSLQQSRIEGTLTGRVGGNFGGNIWFISQGGLIIGRTAQVDAGGFLAALGSIDTSGFLDPSNTLFKFNGDDLIAGAKLMVLSGGRITGHGGLVAFAGPSIVTRYNATVTAADGGSVLYGAANNFQIRLAPGTAGDFDLVDFIVPSANDGTAAGIIADLAATTSGSSVFVAAVSKSTIGSAVINIEGLVTAQAAAVDGGDIILTGGSGIANRQPAPLLADAAETAMYLNKGSASRDLLIQNVGTIFARPWLRPPEETVDPMTIQEEADCAARGCFSSNGAMLEDGGFPVSNLFDPTAISSITAGRAARVTATASIELGRIVASGDISVEGPSIKANALVASGALTASATADSASISSVGVMKAGSITAKTDVLIDSITAPQQLAVTAGRDIIVGDGTSSVSGKISLTGGQNVSTDLGSGRIDSITAGAFANLRGSAIDVGVVTAPKVFAQAANVNIGSVTSSGDVYAIATGGDAIIGAATAGDDIYVQATHGTASLQSATITGAAPDDVSVTFAGSPDTAGNGRVIQVLSTDFDAKFGLGVGGASGATSVVVQAGQDALVDLPTATPSALSVIAARDATLKAPSVSADSVTAGRDLTVGSTTGDFTLTNSISATRNVTVSAAGVLKVADIRADFGSVSLTGSSITAGAVSASQDLTLKATSGGVATTSFSVGRDLIVQGSSFSLGGSIASAPRDLSITSLGNFTSSTPLSAGRDLTLDVAGTASLGQLTAASNLRIVAGDLNLTGAVTAAGAQIESRAGAIRVGGSAGGSGFVLDSAEFGQLHIAGQLKIYAGSTTGSARGDLALQDLTIDPGSTPDVAFLVGSGATARVQGTVAPATSGGVLRIGDVSDLNWRPNSILVTGALGSATFSGGDYTNIRAFGDVRLAARQDIFLGSDRFISLVQNASIDQINIAAGQPAGVAALPAEQLKVFVTTSRLEVSAENKVVQQNTAPAGSGSTSGLYLTGLANPALIIDPPKLVELYGAYTGTNGQPITGSSASSAITFTIVDTSGAPTTKPSGALYRFNSCDVGTSANCVSPSAAGGDTVSDMNAGLLTTRDQLGDPFGDSDAAGQAAVSSEALTSPPALLAVGPADPDAIVVDPVVTGAGSEEIWRQRRQKR